MTPRRLAAGAAAVALADWCLPFGFLNRLFTSHGWFPTRLTGTFVEALASPGDLKAILIVSAAAPRFWVMGGLALYAIWKSVDLFRRGTAPRRLLWLSAAQVALFLLAEVLLPWAGEHGLLPMRLADALFPVVPRGHGRAYGWLHLPALAAFLLFLRRLPDGHPTPVRVK